MVSDRTQAAIEQLLCAIGDPLASLRDVRAGDADFVRAQCIRIGAAVLSKLPAGLPRIREVLESTTDGPATATERMHLDAAAAWLRGDPLGSLQGYASIVARNPGDLLALRLALSCCFFVGDHATSCDIADAALSVSASEQPGHAHRLALAAFAHAELGDAVYAERLGRAALERNPSCPLGVHAVAHAICESGDSRAGADWMREQRAQWSLDSRMRTHNAWHLAMFDVDNGRPDSAITILDQNLLPAAARWPLDACDAVALLWRLARSGIDVGARWRRLSDAFQDFWEPGFWSYVDLHAAVAHGEARQAIRLRALEDAIAACAVREGYAAERARRLTQPALGALAAWLNGDASKPAQRLGSVSELAEAGGSRAQLGVFVGAPVLGRREIQYLP